MEESGNPLIQNEVPIILRRPLRFKKEGEYPATTGKPEFCYFKTPMRQLNKFPFRHYAIELDSREILAKNQDMVKLTHYE